MAGGRSAYAAAGVDVDLGNQFVERLKPLTQSTTRPGCIGGLGGFAAGFDPRAAGFEDPILYSCTDGVGTKILLGLEADRLHGLGLDLVAMCVNDLICHGARPLYFLDYLATGKLDSEQAIRVATGVVDGCRQAGCALIGGETAELPGLYAADHFDLAGFAVGAAERGSSLPRTSRMAAGDRLYGVSSTGPHANGFTLIRKLLAEHVGRDCPRTGSHSERVAAMLAPTAIYAEPLLLACRHLGPALLGVAHITGGGLIENAPRLLPEGLACHIDAGSWTRSPIFAWLDDAAALDPVESYRTFNQGIGLVLCTAADAPVGAELAAIFADAGHQVTEIGRVVETGRAAALGIGSPRCRLTGLDS